MKYCVYCGTEFEGENCPKCHPATPPAEEQKQNGDNPFKAKSEEGYFEGCYSDDDKRKKLIRSIVAASLRIAIPALVVIVVSVYLTITNQWTLSEQSYDSSFFAIPAMIFCIWIMIKCATATLPHTWKIAVSFWQAVPGKFWWLVVIPIGTVWIMLKIGIAGLILEFPFLIAWLAFLPVFFVNAQNVFWFGLLYILLAAGAMVWEILILRKRTAQLKALKQNMP